MAAFRTEKDSLGEIKVSKDALYAAQTARAIENFPISGIKMPPSFIQAISELKRAAAFANFKLGHLSEKNANAIMQAAEAVISGEYDQHFPVDVFQTGSGTSTNMNANEVIANLAQHFTKLEIHPNDHVNMGQSSNDVIPSTIHISAAFQIQHHLLPAVNQLIQCIKNKADAVQNITKTGRTHLMDAMPVTLTQELSGWATQIKKNKTRITQAFEELKYLALGGTAVGTGINADPNFAKTVCNELSQRLNIEFKPNDNYFESLSAQEVALNASSALKTLASSLMKIANDLRWMNSGPLAGLGEIALPALQPGSSIMPGKVNPVIPEAVCMVAAQVIGNDSAITIGAQAGNFQLNVMLPMIAHNLLQSIKISANACSILAQSAIEGFTVNEENIKAQLSKNPILVTALNAKIGYELGAQIAKTAYKEKRPVLDVAKEMTELSEQELLEMLNPQKLTLGGIVK